MSVNNTGVRADIPRPTTPSGAGAAAGAAFVPSNVPNNPSQNNKGDPLGNATVSLLRYMFEVLPGRATGAPVPVASDAQTRTPQLMASVHAQDAVAAQQQSWDSAFWVKAGNVFSETVDGLGRLVGVLARHARLPHMGPMAAAAAPLARPSANTLRELEASLTPHFTLEKSEALLRYEADGGDVADDLVILFPDPDHTDKNVQKSLDAVVHMLMQVERGDRLMKEHASANTVSKERIAAVCGVPADVCDIFTEPASTAELLQRASDTVRAAIDLLQWYVPNLPDADADVLVATVQKIDLRKTTAVSFLIKEINTYSSKVNPNVERERRVRWKTFYDVNMKYQTGIQDTSGSRSSRYLEQADAKRAQLAKGAKLLVIFGSAHVDDVRTGMLKDPKKKYLIANLKPVKVEL